MIKEQYIRWGGIPVLGVILAFIVKDHEKVGIAYSVFASIIFTAVFWNGCVLIIAAWRNAYSHIEHTAKRLMITSLSIAVFLILGGNIMRVLFGFQTFLETWTFTYFFEHVEVKFFTAFFISSIYESTYFFDKWTKAIKLNEELKNQHIRTQFEVLQNQMSPHFLFNSLNTLTTLIAEDQKTAIDFTQTLSEVYRYILQNKEKELVSLRDELNFSKSYVYLLEIRYPKNLHVTYSVDSKYEEFDIAPLTLQMLIENAIKHNIVSKTDPLYIDIYVGLGEVIVVKNNLQPKKIIEKPTKTGLTNIKKRYAYLGTRAVDVIISQTNFMVTIPLIRLTKETEYLSAAEA